MLANTGDTRDEGLIPRSGRSSGAGNGNSLQYSCLKYPTERGTWSATVHGVVMSQTQLGTQAHQKMGVKDETLFFA